jgi:trk system potassium uptake protein TrkH
VRIPVVAALVGETLLYFAAAFGPPLVLAFGDNEGPIKWGFALAMALSLGLGMGAHAAFRQWKHLQLHRMEALATVSLTWLIVGLISGIPYLFEGLTPVDAAFEGISGLTTTGATVLTDFEAHSRAFYLWRSMTQWFGGIGIIALFVVVLPRLGIAGRQLFFAEASEASDSIRPQVRKAAARLWILYGGLTALCFSGLVACGFPAFDALCHAFATLSAGGFSPQGLSIAAYDNPAAEWVLVVFMILAGSSFALLYRAGTTDIRAPLRDNEFRFYILAIVILSFAAAAGLGRGFDASSIRAGFFQVASLISSTGFASEDFEQWDDRAKVMLVVAMLIGGCAGSAAGGPKVVRILIFAKYVLQTITRTLHPDAILPYKWQGRVMSGRIMRSIIALVVLYFVGYIVIGMIIVALGVELEDGFFIALACLSNIGPAFGEAGPMGSYAGFPDSVKVVLTVAMWVGRLEIVAALAMFHPDFIRNIRWRDRVDRRP